jgi:hypothetical protein
MKLRHGAALALAIFLLAPFLNGCGADSANPEPTSTIRNCFRPPGKRCGSSTNQFQPVGRIPVRISGLGRN